MTTPSARDLQRASRAYSLAAAMATWCCADHLGEADERPTLANVPITDAIDVLGRMLQLQIGQPVTVVTTPTAEGAWQLAEQVAENASWDFHQFADATRLANERREHHRDVADIRRLPETDEPVPGADR